MKEFGVSGSSPFIDPIDSTRCDVDLRLTTPYAASNLPPIHDFVAPEIMTQTKEVVVFEREPKLEPPMSWQDAMTA